jgi:hypothetical protein
MAINARTVLKTVELESYIKKDFLDKSFNKSGLCAFCSRKVLCCLSSSCGLVYDCDDYDAGEEASGTLTFSSLDLSKEEEPEESGLCAHCQNREICQLKRINGGVWHCEEYL